MRRRPEFVSIGIISKAHGIKGEVIVSPITDNPQQFFRLKELYVSDGNGKRHILKIERIREKQNTFIIKFHGIEERDQAEILKHFYVEKRLEKNQELLPDEYFVFDLIGLQVKTTDGEIIGVVKDVLSLPANDVYEVQDKSRQILIPAIKSIVKKIDLENELILIEFLDGLF